MIFNQEKIFKDMLHGYISVKEMAYQLKVTSNKRQALYKPYESPNGEVIEMFNDTRPYNYNDLAKKLQNDDEEL